VIHSVILAEAQAAARVNYELIFATFAFPSSQFYNLTEIGILKKSVLVKLFSNSVAEERSRSRVSCQKSEA
jgi:hypothetical protein